MGAGMRRIVSGAALVLIAGLAGCGKGATNTTASNTTTTTTTVTAAPAPASLTSVPFVGCAQDGQSGPSPAPSGAAKTAMLDPVSASKLAFYSADGTTGVLAPRGWNCFGDYGSNGAMLYVAPIPMQSATVLGTNFAITGPGIELAINAGDTSGRFTVAKIIARLFPANMSFAQGVIAEGVEPASDFPTGAPPTDKLMPKGATMVEFETPGGAQGVGSIFSQLTPSGDPIDGVAVLEGATPDAAVLSVRLTPDMRAMTPMILQQFETDSAAPASGTTNAQPAAVPAPVAGPAPTPQPISNNGGGNGGGAYAPLTTVGNFYYALGQGDGATASSLVIPQKRAGNYAPAALSNYYGRMVQPLQLQSSSMTGPNTVYARYTFVAPGGRACNGAANITTTQIGGQTLIASIQALNGC
jgi:hypothetical protein